jgi:hypothetical protein
MTTENDQSPINWSLSRLKDDQLAKTLLANSHLTHVQFVTFITDLLWAAGETSDDHEKLHRRTGRRQVSKGAFNRSLAQARRNVIKSVYTIFLLAYFGLFDSPKLEPFLRLGDEMKTFLDARNETRDKHATERDNAMKVLEDALEAAVGDLARMGSFKRQRDVT